MSLKVWLILFSILHKSNERETFNDFLNVFTGCTLEIFTSRTYLYDDSRLWVADASLTFPKTVKDIKLEIGLVVEARSNETIEENLLSQKSHESVRAKNYCRIGFIGLQGYEEREYGHSAANLFSLMYRTPEPQHVFIRVGVPLPADFVMPTIQFAYLCDKFEGITCEMFVRGNTIWIFLPKSYLELVFIDNDNTYFPQEIQFSSISAASRRRLNFERRHHGRFSNMEGVQVDVGQIGYKG
ncbi:hypothetical protein Fcan01_23306 [Folsomia candida]|uniref:Uncharacterized protein n=1 Tax=Folsomia candida TaxID=158441 RepID=A0A226DAE8_FOLCA|nr:hypothetical protein Fcan01_23306 [Folsomia candida]